MDAFKAKGLPLHVLINNAGLQAPYDDRTEEGFEVTAALPDCAAVASLESRARVLVSWLQLQRNAPEL